jgi:hypothetical protein
MRLSGAFLAMLLLGLGGGQSAQDQQEKPPTLGKEPQEQPRPTLGEAPSLGGPRTSTTTDLRKLLRVRTVYIEAIDNSLNDKLAEALGKMGPFRVVAKRSEADAVLRGTCFDSRRLKRLHSEVFLTDPHGGSIWQDIIRQPFNPPPLDKAVTDSASVIIAHLGESVREAQRK